jgi:acetyl-CoA carboxylase/biotin carboxylase 1
VAVVSAINTLLTQYAYSVNSMFCTFPTQAIAGVLDKHAATLAKKQEKDDFVLLSKPVAELIQRYRNGIRGHAKLVLSTLLRRYLDTESLFSPQVLL